MFYNRCALLYIASLQIYCVLCLFMTCDNVYCYPNCAHVKVHLITGCHAEARWCMAQGLGMWELWTVINPNFPSILCPQSHLEQRTSFRCSPDIKQSKRISICRGRLPTAWVLALLVIHCLLTITSKKLVKSFIVRASSPSRPDLKQSSNSVFIWNNIHDTFSIRTRPGYNNRFMLKIFFYGVKRMYM